MSDSKEVGFYSVNDIQTIANKMAPTLNKKPEDLFTKMMIAQAEGIHVAHADQIYHVIHGTACLKSAEVQARFQEDDGKIEWLKTTDIECTARFTHPKGADITITWNKDRAINSGLWGKNTWKSHPQAMLRARVIGEGVRYCYPACLRGKYSVEEMEDVKFSEPRNVTNPQTVTPKAPEFKPQEPRIVSPETEHVHSVEVVYDDQFTDTETEDKDFEDPTEPGLIPPLEQWSIALDGNEAFNLVFEWAKTQTEDTQADIVDAMNTSKEFKDSQTGYNVGIIRSMFLHPVMSVRMYRDSEKLVIDHFNENVGDRSAEDIENFLGTVSKQFRSVV